MPIFPVGVDSWVDKLYLARWSIIQRGPELKNIIIKNKIKDIMIILKSTRHRDNLKIKLKKKNKI